MPCIQCPQVISNWFPPRPNTFEPTLGTPASSTNPHRSVVQTQIPDDMRSFSSNSLSEMTPAVMSISVPTSSSAHQLDPEENLSPSQAEVQRFEQKTWNMFYRISEYRAQHPPLRPAAMNVTINNIPSNQASNVTIENPNRDVNVENPMYPGMIFKMSV